MANKRFMSIPHWSTKRKHSGLLHEHMHHFSSFRLGISTTVVASFYASHSCSKRHCRRECRMTQNLQTRSMPFLVPQFLLRAHPVAARRRRRRRRDIVSRFFDELHTRTTCLVPPDACRSDNIRHARIVRQQKVWALPNSITVTVCSYRSNTSCTISTHTCSS